MTAFQSLIKEAFIDPIRSVLIVDDQYPTWAEILNEQLPEAGRDTELNKRSAAKSWRTQSKGTLSVINQFRAQNPALIIDIHDAQEGGMPLERTANHLHQSDLLVLDYNLEGESSGLEGRRARQILKSVLRNHHFNLIVIHTQEKQLSEVFYRCLLSLCSPLYPSLNQSALVQCVQESLDDLTDDELFNSKELADHFDHADYVKFRHKSNSCEQALRSYMRNEGPLSRLAAWADKLNLTGKYKRGFALWAIEKFEKDHEDIFSKECFDGLNWTLEDDKLWLRTGRGFVTFVKKNQQNLLGELQSALEAWRPSPSRLLSAKVRHEINCNGVEAEDRTLSKAHVFAYFYDLIRKSGTEEKRATLVREHLARQAETLSHQITSAVVKFGESIFVADECMNQQFASHYGVDLSDKIVERAAASQFNSYISTLPLVSDDDHLDCGHIFEMGNEWWVCATPACDMEPGQNTIAFTGNSSELRPFTALKLIVVKSEDLTEKHINSGRYCFAEVEEGKIECLGLQDSNSDFGSDKVTWRTFVAKKDGRLSNRSFDILSPVLNEGEIELAPKTAQVKAKLRYEYALNYIQKVGASVTRIGLGYRAASFTIKD